MLSPLEVVCCYAREDEAYLNKLRNHLKPLQYRGMIRTWHDREISPGSDYDAVIKAHLDSAQLIILLVSPDFLASDYCYGIELQRTLIRHDRQEVVALPVILRPCAWKHTAVGKLQVLPKDGEPITTWPNQDTAFLTVIEGIIQVIDILQRQGEHEGTSPKLNLMAPPPFRGISSGTPSASEASPASGQFQVLPVITPAANLPLSPTKGEKALAVLSYLSPAFLLGYPVGLLIIYLFGQRSYFARFHLIQAILFSFIITATGFLAAFAVEVISGHLGEPYSEDSIVVIIPLVFYSLIALALIVLACRGKYTKLPLIGGLAEKFANRINKSN